MGNSQSATTTTMSSEGSPVTFVLDTKANGCSGMFWRTEPQMSKSSSDPSWPKNGAVLKGWKYAEHPGWVKIDHPKGFWLPESQHGNQIIFYQ